MKFFNKGEIMNKFIKFFLIIATLVAVGYGAFVLYHIVIEDAVSRIKQGATEGVSKGIGKGVGNVINPFKWL